MIYIKTVGIKTDSTRAPPPIRRGAGRPEQSQVGAQERQASRGKVEPRGESDRESGERVQMREREEMVLYYQAYILVLITLCTFLSRAVCSLAAGGACGPW